MSLLKHIRVLGSLAAMLAMGLMLAGLGVTPATAQDAESEDSDPKESASQKRALANRMQDAISSEFVLMPPAGTLAKGIREAETETIKEMMAGAIQAIQYQQNSKGVIDLYGPLDRTALGNWVTGTHALSVWVMLEMGASTKNPGVENAVKILSELIDAGRGASLARRANIHSSFKGVQRIDTYELAVVMMMYHSLATKRQAELDAEKKSADAKPAKLELPHDRTAASAKRSGQELSKRLTKSESITAKSVLKELVSRQAKDGGWTYGHYENLTDPSNSYFAMLGTYAGFRLGLWTPAKQVLDTAAKYWVTHQRKGAPDASLVGYDGKFTEKDGVVSMPTGLKTIKASPAGWGYDNQNPQATDVRFSMTAAGVICLMLVRHMYMNGAGEAKGAKHVEALDGPIQSGLAYFHEYLAMDPLVAAKKQRELKEQAEAAAEAAAAKPDPRAAKDEGKKGEAKNEDGKEGEAKKDEKKSPPLLNGTQAGFLMYPINTGFTMYAVGFAGLLTGNDHFGACEWYPLGARAIIKRQSHLKGFDPVASGEARDAARRGGNNYPDTRALRPMDPDVCFDMLFLKMYLANTPTEGGK